MAASEKEVREAVLESVATGMRDAFARIMREVAAELSDDRIAWVEAHALLEDEEAAKLLGITPASLRDLRDLEGLPHLRIGRRIRYDRGALREWIQARIVRGVQS